jgi:RNA polymerase sigma-70 factor (ECF subfamily)
VDRQRLQPQLAALILRDVLGFSAAETAHMLGTTPTSVYSSLQRAHKTVSERVPDVSQQRTLRALGEHGRNELVERYVRAWQRADVAGIVKMLTEDATFSMPPIPNWFLGPAAIGDFLATLSLVASNRWQLVPAAPNGQLAVGHYLWHRAHGAYEAHSINVMTLHGNRIAALTTFFLPDAFAEFGLDAAIPALSAD